MSPGGGRALMRRLDQADRCGCRRRFVDGFPRSVEPKERLPQIAADHNHMAFQSGEAQGQIRGVDANIDGASERGFQGQHVRSKVGGDHTRANMAGGGRWHRECRQRYQAEEASLT